MLSISIGCLCNVSSCCNWTLAFDTRVFFLLFTCLNMFQRPRLQVLELLALTVFSGAQVCNQSYHRKDIKFSIF
jgi:hypothetical protein